MLEDDIVAAIDVPGVDTLKAMANQKTADPEAGEIKVNNYS